IYMEADEDGYVAVYYGGAQMVKMSVANKVPPGYYSFSSASSSGGMGTGMVYVGAQSYEGYTFYENGTFDTSSSGGVMVSGDNIGGGSSRENESNGSYTIKNSVLTLSFKDGSIKKHSFFYETEGEDFLCLIDGSIFFYEKMKAQQKNEAVAEESSSQPDAASTQPAPLKALEVFESVKKVHGAEAIDALKTLKAEVLISGMRLKVLMDIERQFIRLESLEPTFPYIEQLEGTTGWIYQQHSVRKMSEARVKEMRLTFISGFLGLQGDVLDRTKILESIEGEEGLALISAEVGQEKTGYIIQSETNTLAATIVIKAGEKEVTYLSDFKRVDGLLLPFKETTVTDEATIDVIYKTYTVNPTFTETEWSKKK
ncbi:MAG: hypothetical protein WA810_03205, partial [Maribacter sp.]